MHNSSIKAIEYVDCNKRLIEEDIAGSQLKN